MARAHASLKQRYKLFKKAFKVATKIDRLAVIDLEGTEATRYVHFGKEDPAFAKHLRAWGEAGTATLKTKSTLKLGDHGIACMMVDYALDHEGDVYEMWDPTTNLIHTTRDVIWLRQMFYKQTQHISPDQTKHQRSADIPMPSCHNHPEQDDAHRGIICN
jgi:hypothetical protein